MTQYEVERFWQLADDISQLNGWRNINLSGIRGGGVGGSATDLLDFAAEIHGAATEDEYKAFALFTLTGNKVRGFDAMVYRYGKRVKQEVIDYGYYLLDKL